MRGAGQDHVVAEPGLRDARLRVRGVRPRRHHQYRPGRGGLPGGTREQRASALAIAPGPLIAAAAIGCLFL
ncbi:hypothetical protein [Nonomuraea sp. NPDC049504]|uniref:hypothetical protein n=1 Tax=Nonomuraea sp. NPDC049504 TaxID=3154729 RepID=UPI003424797E